MAIKLTTEYITQLNYKEIFFTLQFYKFLGFIVSAYFAAGILSVLVESPIISLEKLWRDHIRFHTSHKKDVNGKLDVAKNPGDTYYNKENSGEIYYNKAAIDTQSSIGSSFTYNLQKESNNNIKRKICKAVVLEKMSSFNGDHHV